MPWLLLSVVILRWRLGVGFESGQPGTPLNSEWVEHL
jgi:hypothetical protein